MNKQVINALIELQNSIDKQAILIDKLFPVCPKCKKTMYTKEEIEFLESTGMCLNCDHLQGEIDSNIRLEAYDQIAEYADQAGVSPEEYLDDMGL